MSISRREEVLHAAAELFAEQGFHAVGMRAIADAVGVRGSSLYHYFPSKVDLLHAIAVDSTRAFIESQLEDLNPNSITTIQAQVEGGLAEVSPETAFQFERHGYFVADRFDTQPGKPVFNRTVTLRDSWGKTGQ